jgi:hypothetical protein
VQYAGLIFLTVITTLVSVGYLLLLVRFQPSARDELRAMVGLKPLPRPDPVPRPSRATVAQARSTVHHPHGASTVDVELVRHSAAGWYGQSVHHLDAEESERGTSFAGWAKSSVAFLYEDDVLGGYDGRTEEELFAALADQPSVTTESTTTNSMHSMHQSLYSMSSITTMSTARKAELSSLGSASAGVRSTEDSIDL